MKENQHISLLGLMTWFNLHLSLRMQDTIRNLMLFVLNIPIPYWSTLSTFQLPRNLEEYFVNPERPDQALHVSLIFNGHFSVWDGNLGLDSLQDSTYRYKSWSLATFKPRRWHHLTKWSLYNGSTLLRGLYRTLKLDCSGVGVQGIHRSTFQGQFKVSRRCDNEFWIAWWAALQQCGELCGRCWSCGRILEGTIGHFASI